MTIIYKNIYDSMFILHFYNYILFTDNHIRVIIILLCVLQRFPACTLKRFYIILYDTKETKKSQSVPPLKPTEIFLLLETKHIFDYS